MVTSSVSLSGSIPRINQRVESAEYSAPPAREQHVLSTTEGDRLAALSDRTGAVNHPGANEVFQPSSERQSSTGGGVWDS